MTENELNDLLSEFRKIQKETVGIHSVFAEKLSLYSTNTMEPKLAKDLQNLCEKAMKRHDDQDEINKKLNEELRQIRKEASETKRNQEASMNKVLAELQSIRKELQETKKNQLIQDQVIKLNSQKDNDDLKRMNRKFYALKNKGSEYDKKLMDEIIEHSEFRVPCDDSGNRNRNMARLNPHQVYGNYCSKILNESEFGNIFPEFKIEMIQSSIPSNIPYEEYRFTALGGTGHPQLLISTFNDVFICRNGRFEQMARNHVRIPENTILLVDQADEVKKSDSNRIRISTEPPVIRILDAAVLHGDKVADLPYEARMQAAQQFMKIWQLKTRTIKQGSGNRVEIIKPYLITCAQTYSLSEIGSFRSNLEELKQNRELTVLFKEGNFTFRCHGLRFNRIIKQEWQMKWSKSKQVPYLHSPEYKQAGSILEEQWAEKNVYASFWDNAIWTNKDKTRMTEMMRQTTGGCAVPSTVWSWKPCIRTPYGPDKILNHDGAFDEKPTIASIKAQIESTDLTAQRIRK